MTTRDNSPSDQRLVMVQITQIFRDLIGKLILPLLLATGKPEKRQLIDENKQTSLPDHKLRQQQSLVNSTVETEEQNLLKHNFTIENRDKMSIISLKSFSKSTEILSVLIFLLAFFKQFWLFHDKEPRNIIDPTCSFPLKSFQKMPKIYLEIAFHRR